MFITIDSSVMFLCDNNPGLVIVLKNIPKFQYSKLFKILTASGDDFSDGCFSM